MTEQQLKRIHPLDIPLEVFLADLPTRPCRIIKAEMAYFTLSGDESIKPPFTVRHLLMFSRKEIRDWPNMGKKSLNEIEEWLRNIGLQLWEQHDERSLRLLRDHPMYYAAPAEEEAPQREHHDINKIAEALRRVGLTLLQTANGYHVMKLGEVTAQAQQQPSTPSPKQEKPNEPQLATGNVHARGVAPGKDCWNVQLKVPSTELQSPRHRSARPGAE